MSKQELLTAGFREVLNKMTWLNSQKMKAAFEGFNASEVHSIEYIGANPDSNVTKLAEAFYQTRGGISKITKKLLHKGVIESYQKPGNKKEIYFRLTPKGETVYQIHAKLHAEFNERDKIVFDQMTDKQSDTILIFLKNYSRHLDAEILKQEREIPQPYGNSNLE